jgi:hypothetical protein
MKFYSRNYEQVMLLAKSLPMKSVDNKKNGKFSPIESKIYKHKNMSF